MRDVPLGRREALIKVIVAACQQRDAIHSTLPPASKISSARSPDGEHRLRADADQAGLVLAKGIEVADRGAVAKSSMPVRRVARTAVPPADHHLSAGPWLGGC